MHLICNWLQVVLCIVSTVKAGVQAYGGDYGDAADSAMEALEKGKDAYDKNKEYNKPIPLPPVCFPGIGQLAVAAWGSWLPGARQPCASLSLTWAHLGPSPARPPFHAVSH